MEVGSPVLNIRHITRTKSLPAQLRLDYTDSSFPSLTVPRRRSPALDKSSNSSPVKTPLHLTLTLNTNEADDVKPCEVVTEKPAEEKASTSRIDGCEVDDLPDDPVAIHLPTGVFRPYIDMGNDMLTDGDQLLSVARITEMLRQTAERRDDRWLDLDFDIPDDEDSDDEPLPPSYDKGPMKKGDCEICMTESEAFTRFCCHKLVCLDCMAEFLTVGIKEAQVHFTCPVGECAKSVPKDEILFHLHEKEEILEKYRRFLAHANMEPNKKTCPHCSYITEMEEKPRNKYGHTIICIECGFSWCFECQSPSHEGIKCKENMKGLKALRAWAKENSHGQRNARKCPKCKLLIQRTSGCDHMTCSQCKTDFCYKCGERHMSSRVFGHHYGRLSIFGCPHNFMNGRKKHLRRFVRGSIFTAKLTGATIGSAVIVGLLPVALVAALFAGPVVGFVRLHRYRRTKRERKMYLAIRNSRKMVLKDEDPFLQQLQRLEPRRDVLPGDEWDILSKIDWTLMYGSRSVSNSSLNTMGEVSNSRASVVPVEVTACAEPEPVTELVTDGDLGRVAERSEVTHL